MNKIAQAFARRKAFIAYLMGGDPTIDVTRQNILALQKAGADLIEIGIPFSDPIAEGEVIQAASTRALSSGASVHKLFEMAASLKGELHIPLVFMTYLNPVLNMGYEVFCQNCATSGISGLIVPDLPYEEQAELKTITQQHGIALISLIAPTSGERARMIAQAAEGFIYLVSSMGTTGMRQEIKTDLASIVAQIKSVTPTPVAIGFGIHSAAQARTMSMFSDGIIIGSAIVNLIAEHKAASPDALLGYASEIRAALDV